MPLFPKEVSDPFEFAGKVLDKTRQLSGLDADSTLPGFTGSALPSSSSFASRLQSSGRPAGFGRNMVRWFVPESGVIEMYINPQTITYQFKKHISNQRTKGGYLLQYWGEDLTQVSINGTTGSAGIEGINVLHDVYRAEQIAFDPYALALASDRDNENSDQFSFLGDFPDNSLGSVLTSAGNSFSNLVSNAIETGGSASTRAQPTLASIAFSVEMYWSGWVFRGYFTDFRLDEKADRLGLFDYSMTFMVTQRRGLRSNFLAWHRHPDGPSNSDPQFGRPYSFAGLALDQSAQSQRANEEGGISAGSVLKTLGSIVGPSNGFTSIF